MQRIPPRLLKRRHFVQYGLAGMGMAILGSCVSDAGLPKQTLKNTSKSTILVIGAGISGLAAAREATSVDYPATVHGAFLSGIREAKQAIDLLDSREI